MAIIRATVTTVLVALGLWACGFETPLDEDPAIEGKVAAAEQECGESQERSVALETGVTMAYVEQGSRHGDPVILVHGYTDAHHSFDRTLPLLSRRQHVFAIDLRGHGNSSKPSCCYTQSDFAADVVAFMNAMGLGRASLVGHSMGSFVVQQVALDYPGRVDRLVLIGSAPTVAGNAGAIELMGAVDTLVEPLDPEFVRAFQASTFYRPIPDAFLDNAVVDSLKVPLAVWKQALTGLLAEDHSSRLGSIAADTLILYGDKDVFFAAAEQTQLDAAIPRSRLVVYPDTGHAPHVEVPLRVALELNGFLR